MEGPSDLLYLKVFSSLLSERKRTGLDERWTICPSGGVDKVAAFLTLFGGNKLNIAVLVDLAQGQKNKVEELRRHALLHAGRVFSADHFAEQKEADVEDSRCSARHHAELLDLFLLDLSVIDLGYNPRIGRVPDGTFATAAKLRS